MQYLHFLRGEFPLVLEFEQKVLAAYACSPPNPRMYMWTRVITGWTLGILGEFDRGLDKCRLVLSQEGAASDPSVFGQALWVMAIIFISQSSFDQAIEHAQRSIDVGPTPADKAWPQFVLGWALARRSPEAAIELIEPLDRLFRSAAHEVMVPWAAVALGEAYACAGKIDDALRTLRDGVEFTRRGSGMKHWEACAHRLLGEVGIHADAGTDARATAEHEFEMALSLFETCRAQPDLARTYAGIGRLKLKQGKQAEARSALNKALEICEALGMKDEPVRIRGLIQQLSAA
jgi:tetratricopeptide (TPR) repeat protein